MRKSMVVAAVFIGLGPAGHVAAGEGGIERSRPAEFEALGLPFSEAVRAGRTLYLSGQLGTRPGSKELAPGGIAAETAQALENIRAVLERHGAGLDRVVKCTVFMRDMAEWEQMNQVYRRYFAGGYPARSALGASDLALDARVEIECIAVLDGVRLPDEGETE